MNSFPQLPQINRSPPRIGAEIRKKNSCYVRVNVCSIIKKLFISISLIENKFHIPGSSTRFFGVPVNSSSSSASKRNPPPVSTTLEVTVCALLDALSLFSPSFCLFRDGYGLLLRREFRSSNAFCRFRSIRAFCALVSLISDISNLLLKLILRPPF